MADWNLADAFEAIADALPDRAALVQGSRRVTWSELDERASRLAAALTALGLRPDSKVALYLYNSNEYEETSFATFKIRGVHVNVNYRYLEDELAYLIDNADAEVVVFHGVLGEHVAAVRERCPTLRAIVQVDDGSPRIDGALDYEELIATHDPMPRIRARATTTGSSTPAGPPGCRRVSCGAMRTSSARSRRPSTRSSVRPCPRGPKTSARSRFASSKRTARPFISPPRRRCTGPVA